MDLTHFRWRKSSYSGANGGNCVEVGSGTRIGWRKSSYSSASGDNCVEVGTAVAVAVVAVRDSKDPGAPALTVSPPTWLAFTRRLQQS